MENRKEQITNNNGKLYANRLHGHLTLCDQ